MALNPTYENANTLKKVTVGGATYFLKDADLRTLVESFGSVVYKDVVTTFDAEGVDIATEKATAEYIKEQIAGITGAMHFMGVVTRTEGQTDLEAIAAFYAAKKVDPAAGDVLVMSDNAKEYICTVGGDTPTYEELGDQILYLTIAQAAKEYVKQTTTVAGIALDHNITVDELSAEAALNLKALSHKDSATGQVDVIDAIDNITVGKAGEYAIDGQSSVTVAQTFSALDVTPAGAVEVKADKAVAATYEKTSGATIAATAASETAPANYTPAGTVSLPSLNATVTLTGKTVKSMATEGTAYELTNKGAVAQAADTTSKFVKKGVSFSVDEADEALTLAYVANTDTDFYTDAVTKAGAVTYTEPELSGSLPTFSEVEVAASTGATAAASYDGNATFAGTGVVLGATLAYDTADASVTQPTYTATFAGTEKSVTPAAATTAEVATKGGKITVAEQDTAITHTTKKATVTVQ